MGKKSKNADNANNTSNANNTNNAEILTEVKSMSESNEIVVAEEMDVAGDDRENLAHLAPALPHLDKVLSAMYKPSSDEFEEAITKLAPAGQQAFRDMLQSLNPTKPGMHVQRTGMQIPTLYIDQGVGNNKAKPETSVKGLVFSSTGEVVCAPSAAAKMFGVKDYFNAAVVGYFETRQFWLPKDAKGNMIVPPGTDFSGNGPFCRSLDRVRGDRFGACATCPNKPVFDRAKQGQTTCKNEVVLYVVLEGFNGIYQINMSGTSLGPGARPIKTATSSPRWKSSWDYYFRFETISQTNEAGDRKWYAWKTSVAVSPEHPQGLPVDPASRGVLTLIQRQIDTEVFYPRLADTYTRAAEAKPALEAGAGVADMAALVADGPDFSNNL